MSKPAEVIFLCSVRHEDYIPWGPLPWVFFCNHCSVSFPDIQTNILFLGPCFWTSWSSSLGQNFECYHFLCCGDLSRILCPLSGESGWSVLTVVYLFEFIPKKVTNFCLICDLFMCLWLYVTLVNKLIPNFLFSSAYRRSFFKDQSWNDWILQPKKGGDSFHKVTFQRWNSVFGFRFVFLFCFGFLLLSLFPLTSRP